MVVVVEILFLYIILTFGIMLFIFVKKIYVSTVAMAVVMSFGITTQGVLLNFFGAGFFHSVAGRIISIVDLALWSSCIFSFFLALFNHRFTELHYSNPINRFGIGTCVAGTSICGIILEKQFHGWDPIVKVILYSNVCLWFFYILICLRTFADVLKKDLAKRVHGVLLLTTVSTQSIVLLASTVYKGLPEWIALFFTIIGACFYLISFLFIFKRYSRLGDWSFRKDWNNTNCILHGALSITGLACLVSHLLTKNSVMVIWFCAAAVFLIVEAIELFRLFSRIRNYGWIKAVFVYDVSQWSRIFTFAMFYTFTYLCGPNPYFTFHLRKVIIVSGIWFILVLLLFEIVLAVKFLVENVYPRKVKQSNSDSGIHSSF
jgi:hypothetical protein